MVPSRLLDLGKILVSERSVTNECIAQKLTDKIQIVDVVQVVQDTGSSSSTTFKALHSPVTFTKNYSC